MKNIRGLIAVCLLFCMLLTGCQIGDKNIIVMKPLGSKYVFQLGEFSCSVKEAKVYLANYQNIYGEAYTLDLWQHDFGDGSLAEYIKTVTLNELVSVACMSQLAVKRGLVLTEEDEAKLTEAANTYYDSLTEAEKEYLGVSVSELTEYYRHYALGQRVYDMLISEIDSEVSDDEARVMEVMQIFVSDSAQATLVSGKLQAGEDFASVANAYNELSGIQANICRADLPESAENVIFQLDDNEVTGAIEVENGYYFIKCLNKYNAELTEANKEVIVEKRKKEALGGVYNDFIESLGSHINEDVWEGLTIDTTSGIETDSFFDVYKTCCE